MSAPAPASGVPHGDDTAGARATERQENPTVTTANITSAEAAQRERLGAAARLLTIIYAETELPLVRWSIGYRNGELYAFANLDATIDAYAKWLGTDVGEGMTAVTEACVVEYRRARGSRDGVKIEITRSRRVPRGGQP